MSSIALAEGLKSYSERGQTYVDTLKGIIRANSLDVADEAVFREEPMRFIFGAADQVAAENLRKDIKAMRKSGKLAMIIDRMRLEYGSGFRSKKMDEFQGICKPEGL